MSSNSSISIVVGTLKQLSLENRELMRDTIDIMEAPVDPCTFLRQYVATNTPVLIQGAINHWPASRLWTQQYLSMKAGQTEISVELTPNGLGDAVTAYDDPAAGGKGECFCMPCSSKMLFQQFCDIFLDSKADAGSQSSAAPIRQIPYLSVGCCCHCNSAVKNNKPAATSLMDCARFLPIQGCIKADVDERIVTACQLSSCTQLRVGADCVSQLLPDWCSAYTSLT